MTTYTRSSETPHSYRADQRSLAELFADLSQKASLLARQEVQLAIVEMKQKASKATGEIVTIAIGSFLANAALLALVAALIAGLAEFMAVWIAALLVGVLVALVAAFLIRKGVKALQEIDPLPQQTLTTLKEDKEWLAQHITP
jgi:uncharacterized membrane protein YqjE